jgi:hypothetical protein
MTGRTDVGKTRLSKEEKEILQGFEKGEWVPVADFSKRKSFLLMHAIP